MVNNLDIKRDTKRKLTKTLKKFSTLFGGGLGKVDMKPIDIELKEGTTPYASTYYNVPKAYKQTLKKEVNRMCNADILAKLNHVNDSPWASPSFVFFGWTNDGNAHDVFIAHLIDFLLKELFVRLWHVVICTGLWYSFLV